MDFVSEADICYSVAFEKEFTSSVKTNAVLVLDTVGQRNITHVQPDNLDVLTASTAVLDNLMESKKVESI